MAVTSRHATQILVCLFEGEVEMARNYALSAEELAAGFVLTCQSRPSTGRVTVDFDA